MKKKVALLFFGTAFAVFGENAKTLSIGNSEDSFVLDDKNVNKNNDQRRKRTRSEESVVPGDSKSESNPQKRLKVETSVIPEDSEIADLEDAIVSAYHNNAAWKASQAEKNMSFKQYKHAEAVFLPTLDASLTASRVGYQENTNTDRFLNGEFYNSGFGRKGDKETRTKMALQLSQNLFNSFKDVNTMKSKRNQFRAAFHKLKKAEQELIVNVVKTYTAVWAERQKLQAHIKKEENLKKLYESQELCLSAGMATRADVAEAQSRYQTAVYERVDAETKVVQAEENFRYITGMHIGKQIFIPNLDLKLPSDLSKLEDIALKSNQEILQTAFAVRAAMNELDASKGDLGPKCNLELRAERNLSKTGKDFPENNFLGLPTGYNYGTRTSKNVYTAELSVTVPIFHMQSYASIGIYNEKVKQAEFLAKDKVLEIRRNCQVYWRAYKSAEASIKANSTAVKSAEITSESNLDQTNLGMKSNTEFLDAETSLLTARINLANSIKNKIDTAMELFALTGNLDLHSILVALKKHKGILDPLATDQARKRIRQARRSGKNFSKKDWLKKLAEKRAAHGLQQKKIDDRDSQKMLVER